MLTVTAPASARLGQLLKTRDSNTIVRIIRREKRLRLRYDSQRTNDQTFTHDGRIVLAVTSPLAAELVSRTLDVRQTDFGPRLTLRRRPDQRAGSLNGR